jgi:hypothetical protein
MRTRCPAQAFGTAKCRRYHSVLFSSSGCITPDSEDSMGNGTRICPEKLVATVAVAGVTLAGFITTGVLVLSQAGVEALISGSCAALQRSHLGMILEEGSDHVVSFGDQPAAQFDEPRKTRHAA